MREGEVMRQQKGGVKREGDKGIMRREEEGR